MKNKITLFLFSLLLVSFGLSAKTLRILAIGNSFSRDAIEQNLHELALAEGDTAIIGNLFIGGCSLERHVRNLRDDKHDYVYRKIGADGKRTENSKASIADALADDRWDYISLQQASALSGQYDTYRQWMPELVKYVKKTAKGKPEIILHQTWAYQNGAANTGFRNYDRDQMKMYTAIVDAGRQAAALCKVKTIVPSGTAIQNARSSFIGDNMNRDGYHLQLDHGRFTAACAWYARLFGKDVTRNPYTPAGMNSDVARVAKAAAQAAVINPYSVTDLSSFSTDVLPYKQTDMPMEIRIDNLLSLMTLEEKIMQVNQYHTGRNNNPNNMGEEVKKIPAELGSLIYYDDEPTRRNAIQKHAIENSRLGIPMVFGFDAIHGFKTVYPISLAQACSWNPSLVSDACAVSAKEARLSGVDWTFSPMVDVARDPRWGRVSEGYGEDPYANSVFCVASVKGYQGKSLKDSTSVAACLKHYVGYGASEAGRDYVYTEISPQTLWDTYLPPFHAGVKAGAASLMSSFNNISGVPGSANKYTMTDILKKKWGSNAVIVSDWGAVEQLINQGMAKDKKEASALALNAGLDIDMMSHAYDKYLAELINEGRVPMDMLDDAVRRTLRLKFRLGLFENPYTPEVADRFLSPESRDVARRLAVESMVLLKNDSTNLLPMSGRKKIAVIGPLADNQWDLLGNWLGHGDPKDVVSFLEGIKNEFGKDAEIRFAAGCARDGDDRSGFAEAVKTAKWADAVILCLGENLKWSGENASRSTIALPQIQEQLAEEIQKAGRPVVMVLASGRPLDLSRLSTMANAVIEAWQPGVEGGNALAEILSGRANPSARLAITFPRSTGQIPIYYNRRPSGRHHQGFYQDISSEPLYEFGHGLSYTTYGYGELSASKTDITRKDKIQLSIPVTNTGDREGAETVFWYVSDPYSTITRPVKELKHFEKINLKPGETVVAKFTIDPRRDLGFVDDKGNPVLENGEFIIQVADKKIKLNLRD